jgi:hypothetical protein
VRVPRIVPILCAALAAAAITVNSQTPAVPIPEQTEADAYTRYELLLPLSAAKFRIIYEVTATTLGAKYYFNPIRTGSIATDERVTYRATGKALPFDIVGAKVAAMGGVRSRDSTQQYIRVTLAHAVPANDGEARVLIEKTYEDAKSYHAEGDLIVFDRPLGIKRNTVVLPAGYELVACNYPSQVLRQSDGRIAISFWNGSPSEAPLVLKARAATLPAAAKLPDSLSGRLSERAHENRKIVYFLQQPETHAFDLYHDYTESKAGTSTYVNVVRPGSTVANPSARDLDTGEALKFEVLKGDALAQAKLDLPAEDLKGASEAVVFHFPAVKAGESIRLRMYETYTDSVRYTLVGNELLWNRTFGRAMNAVVLPAGWSLTNSSIPAVVSTMPDGRVRLDFVNPRPDQIAVLITAERRGH